MALPCTLARFVSEQSCLAEEAQPGISVLPTAAHAAFQAALKPPPPRATVGSASACDARQRAANAAVTATSASAEAASLTRAPPMILPRTGRSSAASFTVTAAADSTGTSYAAPRRNKPFRQAWQDDMQDLGTFFSSALSGVGRLVAPQPSPPREGGKGARILGAL